MTLDLAGQSPDYSQAETFESQFDPSAQEAFQAFFRFPFAPDTRWKVTVTKDQDGLLTQLAIAPTGEEFLTGTVSTVGAHTAYFTLTPSTQTGSTLPDFQQVPGGYGLYRLRFLTGEGGRVQIDPDSLEMVYPLDPRAVSVLSLTLSPQEDTLFLVTIQEGQTRCLVLDTETMDLRTAFSIPAGKPTQHLEASVSAEDEVLSRTQYDVTQVLPGENCLLALGQETFHFFSQTPEGHYQYRWSGACPTASSPSRSATPGPPGTGKSWRWASTTGKPSPPACPCGSMTGKGPFSTKATTPPVWSKSMAGTQRTRTH